MEPEIAERGAWYYAKNISVYGHEDSGGDPEKTSPTVHLLYEQRGTSCGLSLHPTQAKELVAVITSALQRLEKSYDPSLVGTVE